MQTIGWICIGLLLFLILFGGWYMFKRLETYKLLRNLGKFPIITVHKKKMMSHDMDDGLSRKYHQGSHLYRDKKRN